MNVLVTGGAGYIGSHTCKELARQGHRPIVYDNFFRGHRWAIRFGPGQEGDLLDLERLRQTMRDFAIEAVVHFAAVALVGESVGHPEMYYRTNVVGSLNLLQAMVLENVKLLVFSSTCASYGMPERDTIDESHPQKPINPYGWSKLAVERMIADFATAHALRCVSLRYFNACGADPEGELGEVHDPETHLIPSLFRALCGQVEQFQLHGEDYPTPDGTCIRDYIHILDLASAHIRALDLLRAGPLPRPAYNLGVGQGFSVRQVLDCVEAVAGLPVPLLRGPRRPGDPARLVADNRLAREELGWSPRFTDLPQIVSGAWDWHRKWVEAGEKYRF